MIKCVFFSFPVPLRLGPRVSFAACFFFALRILFVADSLLFECTFVSGPKTVKLDKRYEMEVEQKPNKSNKTLTNSFHFSFHLGNSVWNKQLCI